MVGVSVSATAGRGTSPYINRILGWCGMLLREGSIELRWKLVKVQAALANMCDRLDSFECVKKAVAKHRGLS